MRTILSTIPSEFIGGTEPFLWRRLEHDEGRREIVAVRERYPRLRDAELFRAGGCPAMKPDARTADVIEFHLHLAPADPTRFVAPAQRLEGRFLGCDSNSVVARRV